LQSLPPVRRVAELGSFARMKTPVLVCLSLCLIAGCARFDERAGEREITPRKVRDGYLFKTWPGSTTCYNLDLQGVTDTSAILGPDFSVHYFTFVPEASLALYNGGHPKSPNQTVDIRFNARFGTEFAEWSFDRRDQDCRAEAYIADGEHSFWHVMVIAPSEQRVREIIDQLSSFRQQGKRAAAVRANQTLQATAAPPCTFVAPCFLGGDSCAQAFPSAAVPELDR
jgi:hypothetical protein